MNFTELVKIFFTSDEFRTVAYVGIAIVSSIAIMQIGLAYLFLEWYGRFYDALQALDYSTFKIEILTFCKLATAHVLLYSIGKYINQKYTFYWRKALTYHILEKWKGEVIEGYAQRIQEDCMRFARIVESLYIGILNAVGSIIVFTPILWSLSNIIFPDIPGLLWLLAIIYSSIGILISFYVGHPLPKLEYNNQKQEAKFRRLLEFKDGEYYTSFNGVQYNYFKLFKRYMLFSFWSLSFFQLSVIIPYIICGHALFSGLITLGVLIQVGKAFDKIEGSFSYLIERWMDITELQSVTLRLNQFLTKLDSHENM